MSNIGSAVAWANRRIERIGLSDTFSIVYQPLWFDDPHGPLAARDARGAVLLDAEGNILDIEEDPDPYKACFFLYLRLEDRIFEFIRLQKSQIVFRF